MRELLTDQEVDVLTAYADNAMRVRPTAADTHYDRRTVFRILAAIQERTGYNPLDFWDLRMIFDQLEKEGASGRKKQVSPDKDIADGS